MNILRTKRVLLVIGALLAGVIIYYTLMGLLVYLVTDLWNISVSPADGSLVVLVMLKIIPLICAMLAFAMIMQVGWRKPSTLNNAKKSDPSD